MPRFGSRSSTNLSEAHSDLQLVFNKVITIHDCSVIEGHRGEKEQNRLFHAKMSKLEYPNSKHNIKPSLAVDVIPYPVDWNDLKRFYYFAGIVKAVAEDLGIEIRWGGDWDSDNDLNDQTFFDLPHWELR